MKFPRITYAHSSSLYSLVNQRKLINTTNITKLYIFHISTRLTTCTNSQILNSLLFIYISALKKNINSLALENRNDEKNCYEIHRIPSRLDLTGGRSQINCSIKLTEHNFIKLIYLYVAWRKMRDFFVYISLQM